MVVPQVKTMTKSKFTFWLLSWFFVFLVAQACQLSLSKKLNLLSQLALPYHKIGSRSPSPKPSKARDRQVESEDGGCMDDDAEQSISLSFEPSPSLGSDPPSPCVPPDLEQGTCGRRERVDVTFSRLPELVSSTRPSRFPPYLQPVSGWSPQRWCPFPY